jgi:hypothetical protein
LDAALCPAQTLAETWAAALNPIDRRTPPGVRWHVAFCAEATAYSEPDVSFYNWDGKPGQSMEPREEIAHIPKSNRMPDAPHSVKVETQVVDGV